MKKTCFILSLIFISISSYSQWFSIGADAGYNTTLPSRQNNDIINIQNSLQHGFNVGFYMRIGTRVFAQPGVRYTLSTYNHYVKYNGCDTIQKYTNTIDVPVLLGISAVNKKLFKLRFLIGPKFSFDIGSTKPQSYGENINEYVRKTRLGLDCGIGFDIWKINIDFRYNLFPDLYKLNDAEGNTLNYNTQNSFQVTIGYRIFGDNMKN